MEIISRKEAKALGLKRYYTGKACKNGHISEGYVRGNSCVICSKIEADKSRKILNDRNPHYEAQKSVVRRKKNPERAKEVSRKSCKKYKENNKDYDKKYYQKNKDQIRKQQAEYYKLDKRDKQPT